MNQVQTSGESPSDFERLKRTSSYGMDFWRARELMPLLGYDKWENFQVVMERAKTACTSVGQPPHNHFRDAGNMVAIGSGAIRETKDVFLTRLACYLIAQNGDSRKPQIAEAQVYFAIQTRKQELQEQSTAEEKRMVARERLAASNKRLMGAAKESGVVRYGIFQDEGYKGLYGGRGLRTLKTYKGISPREDLSDRMGHAELAANDFRATQAEERLVNSQAHSEAQACQIHNEVGARVRQNILDNGNTPPEDLKLEADIRPLLAKKKQAEKKQIGGSKS